MKRKVTYTPRRRRSVVRTRPLRQWRGPEPLPPAVWDVINNLQPITPATDMDMTFSGTGTGTRTKYRSRTGVTSQHDYSLIYRKKSMPYGKRKRWTAFLRKNIAADMALMGTKTFVFNHTVIRTCENYNSSSTTPPAAGSPQDCAVCHLYGATSAVGDTDIQESEIGYRDIHRITDALVNGSPEGDVSRGAFETTKLLFGSAVIDITITNLAPVVDGETGLEFYGGRLEVDLYDIVYRKTTADRGFHGLRLMFNDAATRQDDPQSPWQRPTFLTRGWTPFDTPQALSQQGIKILKKTKYFMSPNTSVTYQVRDARNRLIDLLDGLQPSGLARKGYTRTLLILFKVVAGEVKPGRLAVGCTRKYMLKLSKSAGSDQSNVQAGAG